jgi:hypothetical protein
MIYHGRGNRARLPAPPSVGTGAGRQGHGFNEERTPEQLKGEEDEARRAGVAIKSQKKMSGQTTHLRGINTQYESIG